MTTIAYDGKTISADSRITSGNEIITDNQQKIFKLKKNSKNYIAFAISGEIRFARVFEKWIKSNGEFTLSMENTCIVAITNKGKAHKYYDDDNYESSMSECVCVGSGRDYAITALRLGKTPKVAVKIASELDVFTGGKITSLNIKKLLSK